MGSHESKHWPNRSFRFCLGVYGIRNLEEWFGVEASQAFCGRSRNCAQTSQGKAVP